MLKHPKMTVDQRTRHRLYQTAELRRLLVGEVLQDGDCRSLMTVGNKLSPIPADQWGQPVERGEFVYRNEHALQQAQPSASEEKKETLRNGHLPMTDYQAALVAKMLALGYRRLVPDEVIGATDRTNAKSYVDVSLIGTKAESGDMLFRKVRSAKAAPSKLPQPLPTADAVAKQLRLSKSPTHRLKVLDKRTSHTTDCGAVWANPDGSFTLVLGPCVALHANPHFVYTIFPKK